MNYIIKTIQGCNLSCIYCYEQSHNKLNLAMDLDDAKRFIQKVYDYYVHYNPDETLAFHWHGGEPMLLGAGYFQEIIRFQAEVLGSGMRWYNSLQSNLTVLDDGFIELLQQCEGRLLLGISFDFFGDDRVDRGNRNVNARVWKNVKRLQEAGIRTSFLTMLTKGNIEHIDEIYDLVRSQDISIRFNQVFGVPQNRAFGRPPVRVRNTEFREALFRLTRKWLDDSECKVSIDNAKRILMKIVDPNSTRMCWYEKNCLEHHMAITADGTVFPCDSFYVKGFSYGNIFRDPYEKILASEPRRQLLDQQRRGHEGCRGCEFLDYCNGGCPTRAIFRMPKSKVRLEKDPLCSVHRGMFEMIGEHLVENDMVDPDWTQSDQGEAEALGDQDE